MGQEQHVLGGEHRERWGHQIMMGLTDQGKEFGSNSRGDGVPLDH